MSGYKYAKRTKKGEAVFRRDTNESLEFIIDYLKTNNIDHTYKKFDPMVVVTNKKNKDYMYYWTTGRWSPIHRSNRIHYRSNGIKNFVDKYLNRCYGDREELKDEASS